MSAAQLLNPKAFAKNAAKRKAKDPPGPGPGASGSTSVGASPSKQPRYDPATLLNPKSAAQKAKTSPEYKDVQSALAEDGHNTDMDTNSQRFNNLIEQHHGVSRREAPPMKQVRPTQQGDDDESVERKKHGKFDGGTKGGIIGQSVRDMRQKGQDERGPPAVTVDLTNDDDDDVVMTGATYTDDADPKREVCMGYIDVNINADRVPFVTSKPMKVLKNMWPSSKITLRRTPGQNVVIDAIDRQGNEFGKLDYNAGSVLAPLLNGANLHKFRISAYLLPRARKNDEEPRQRTSGLIKCRLTCFCSYQNVRGIGVIMSQKNFFLSDTQTGLEGKELVNPHVTQSFVTKKVRTVMSAINGTRQMEGYVRTAEEIRYEVKNIIDNLPNSDGLPFAEADNSIVTTELLDHQKQALYWLSRKETAHSDSDQGDSVMWKSNFVGNAETFYNVISGTVVREIPTCRGGLFSDDMGLGKTLSILSLIASTLNEATEFGETRLTDEMMAHDSVERNTKSTLLVCPKSVLSNWDEQIKAHLNNSNFKYYTYHGTKRSQDVDELAEYDIIVTSYSIVNSELKGRGRTYNALSRLNFFRVVLDEAHMIRNMTTGVFLSCCALATERRWAVTGTPIQNRLDDLGALIKFIRIQPFEEKGAWEMNFTSKFKSGDPQVLENLKLLVSCIMLRRSKKTIHMEDPDVRTVELDFTPEEYGLYEAFAKDSGRKINAMLSANGLRGRGTAHMLTFITRLRMICCHGRELLSDEDMKVLEGRTVGTAIDLGDENDDKPALTDIQIYTNFLMMRESAANLCNECGKEVPKESEAQANEDEEEREETDGSDTDEDTITGYMTPCYHLVCTSCASSFQDQLNDTCTTDGYAYCPSCGLYVRNSLSPMTRRGLVAEEQRRAEIRSNPDKTKTGHYSGPHTKVRALLAAIDANYAESLALPDGEPPIRSVVFSGWTQYLDLIGRALEERGVPFLRLDGTMSVAARSRVLALFRSDPVMTVMLVSIRAGGQGLNFTAANKVYVMEPQFNPGVEQQAVDRVHRLGQTRKVEITRFIMKDSFEGKIVELQEQKKRLAREAFGEGGKEDAKQRMEGLRSLFK